MLKGFLKEHNGQRLFYKLKDLKRELKWAWQRAYRGWDDVATWDIDYTFLNWIIPTLTQYKKNFNSVPNELYNKYNEDVEKASDEWDSILQIMLTGFTYLYNYDEVKNENPEERSKIKKETFDLFVKWFDNLWD